MHCGVMVTGCNQADWPRLMAGDYVSSALAAPARAQ
jgi:hypothetical protein